MAVEDWRGREAIRAASVAAISKVASAVVNRQANSQEALCLALLVVSRRETQLEILRSYANPLRVSRMHSML